VLTAYAVKLHPPLAPGSHLPEFDIMVKTLTGKSIPLQATSATTVEELKELMCKKEGEQTWCCLCLGGNVSPDDAQRPTDREQAVLSIRLEDVCKHSRQPARSSILQAACAAASCKACWRYT
jgi:hypothetical protein